MGLVLLTSFDCGLFPPSRSAQYVCAGSRMTSNRPLWEVYYISREVDYISREVDYISREVDYISREV